MLLIIDSNYLCHYCAYSSRSLTYGGQATGVIFSFLKQVLSLAKRFKTDRFAFAWDSRKSIRRISYPAYKQNRVDHQKSLEEREVEAIERQQFQELRTKVLPAIGFHNQLFQVGIEADDIIASVAYNESFEQVVIVGADNDLYQLLGSNTSMYKPRDKKLYEMKDFKEEWGIVPNQWPSVKSIAGCNGDNVKGVGGVGEKTAIRYLKGELKGDSKTVQAIQNSSDMIDRNAALVTLPLAGTKTFVLIVDGPFFLNDLLDVIARYGLNSFRAPETLAVWKECFNMRGR